MVKATKDENVILHFFFLEKLFQKNKLS